MKIFIFLFISFYCDVKVLRGVPKDLQQRKLFLFGSADEAKLEEEYQNQREVNNMRMLMSN